MTRDKQFWNDQFALIEHMLKHKGFLVFQGPWEEDRVELEDDVKTVFINSKCWPETRFYTLLHELGHVMISEDPTTFEKENPMYVFASAENNDGRKQRSKMYRVSLISEEIEAWKIGRRVANTLGLYVDDEKYNKHMTENVMSYITWASE